MARPGFEPAINRSEIDRANRYSIGPLLEKSANLFILHTL